MNIERLQERVLSITVLVIGLLFAIFCGLQAGGGNFRNLLIIVGSLAVIAVCLTLRGNIWILIPLFWPLTGAIPTMEVPFAIRDMAVMVVFGAFLMMVAFKIVHAKPKFGAIDFLVFANALYLGTVFLRNPVGVKAFNSELVGGKPYFNIFISGLAYLILCRVPIDLRMVRWLPIFLLPGPLFVAVGSLLVEYAPTLSTALSYIYSEFTATNRRVGELMGDYVDRKIGLMMVGVTGMQVLTAFYRPLTLFIPAHLGRFTLTIAFLGATLMSGFRSTLIMTAMFILLSTYFRRLRRDLLFIIVAGVMGASFLALGNNTLFHLPVAAQRALSFLPGKWDQEATADARASIDWRVDMWNMVWTEDKWIKDKWLGDGFGFTRHELGIMEAMEVGGVGFIGGVQQEAFMINGVFHNGPLSAIRFVGGIGLVLYYSLVALLAVRGVKLIREAMGTPLFPTALFIGMPSLLYAVSFPFGFGQFDLDAPQCAYTAGLLSVLARALQVAKSERESQEIPTLPGVNPVGAPVPTRGV